MIGYALPNSYRHIVLNSHLCNGDKKSPGVDVSERVAIPDERISEDAKDREQNGYENG